jgi:hypothetical protein
LNEEQACYQRGRHPYYRIATTMNTNTHEILYID